MPSCSVSTCKNNNSRTKSEVKYYKFPRVEEYCIKWYLACAKPVINFKFATVCSQHFDASASQRTKQQEVLNYSPKSYRGLKPDAVPTKNIPWNGESTDMLTPKVLNAIRKWCWPKDKEFQEIVEAVKGPKKKRLVVKELLAWFPSEYETIPGQSNLDIGNTLGRNYVLIQPSGTDIQNLAPIEFRTNLSQQSNQIEQIPVVAVPPASHSETNVNNQEIVLCPVPTQQTASNSVKLKSKSTGPQFILVQSPAEQTSTVNKKLVGNVVRSPPPILPDTLKNVPLIINKQITAFNSGDILNRENNELIGGDSFETSGMALLKSEFKDMKRTIGILRDEIQVWQKQYTEMKQTYEALAIDHKCSLLNRKKEVDLAVHAVLSGIFTPGQIKLLLSRGTESRSRKSGIHWTHRDMKTAHTLYSLSPRAYHYLRTDMNYPLPAPSSLKRFRTMIARKLEKNKPVNEGKAQIENFTTGTLDKQVETGEGHISENVSEVQENCSVPEPVMVWAP